MEVNEIPPTHNLTLNNGLVAAPVEDNPRCFIPDSAEGEARPARYFTQKGGGVFFCSPSSFFILEIIKKYGTLY